MVLLYWNVLAKARSIKTGINWKLNKDSGCLTYTHAYFYKKDEVTRVRGEGKQRSRVTPLFFPLGRPGSCHSVRTFSEGLSAFLKHSGLV